ncbi:Peptidase C60 sortase A and B [Fictibacillus macauensis ZFHKF-1]|uniref:Peptidase C60 sortase A and B n=1 Tax=Fictibacillus macauensis ZFHKF-1 TaxID=1196324 RepID=I8IXV0_9BACL|nr:class F sortase [Fictibacillus macauensis]EIT84316.1 Peptidase C60 sortase A and B [Fictibacillus macauensis ZFHKF-1]
MKKGSTIALIVLTCLGLMGYTYWHSEQKESSASPTLSKAQTSPSAQAKAEAHLKALHVKAREQSIVPTKLSIPAIHVKASIEKVGVLDNGQLGVPSSEESVGWYKDGVKPGERGNAVIDGHVDSRDGPAVFFDLKKVTPGDTVMLNDQKGKVLTFVVRNVKSYVTDKAPLPLIFGESKGRHLNLITCTGVFNSEKRTHEKRLVVYTDLVKNDSSQQPSSPKNVQVSDNVISWKAAKPSKVVGYAIYEKRAQSVHLVAHTKTPTYRVKSNKSRTYYVTAINEVGAESAPSKSVVSPSKQH